MAKLPTYTEVFVLKITKEQKQTLDKMKTKLIKNDLYLLLIDEEAEIKEEELIYNSEYQKVVKTSAEYIRNLKFNKTLNNIYHKIIAYYPLTEEAKELDLPLLPNPFEELNFKNIVEDLPEHDALNSMDGTYSSFHYQSEAMIKGYELGYKAAQTKLWKELIKLSKEFKSINLVWVKGHAGHIYNEMCDQLANEAIDEGNFLKDNNYENI